MLFSFSFTTVLVQVSLTKRILEFRSFPRLLYSHGYVQAQVTPDSYPEIHPRFSVFHYYRHVFICVRVCQVSSVVSDSVHPYGLQAARLLCPWDSPDEDTREGCCALFQEICLTKGSNVFYISCIGRWGSLPLSNQGSPLLLE